MKIINSIQDDDEQESGNITYIYIYRTILQQTEYDFENKGYLRYLKPLSYAPDFYKEAKIVGT